MPSFQIWRLALILWAGIGLCACATSADTLPSDPVSYDPLPPVILTTPEPAPGEPDSEVLPDEQPEAVEEEVSEEETPHIEELAILPLDPFAGLEGWDSADLDPALSGFRRSCPRLLKGDLDRPLNPSLQEYGTYGDWVEPCEKAEQAVNARQFFEAEFLPLPLTLEDRDDGLLTGYYEPEVEVRHEADAIYSEPILAKPSEDTIRTRPRSELNASSARVIAYGRPIDVFFLQVQGSGRLHFEDDRVVRAAYGGNNGHPYRSIGRVLIERGELTRDQSSKQNIEAWMEAAGAEAARTLMNENPRYIFFQEQRIAPNEGPNGAMQVPLTPMGSIAVDPKYHPYGTLAWLDTRLPREAGDFDGEPTSLLLVAQDTGSAIKGGLRGDLFFGPGPKAGALAGMMKHRARWTLLVPRALALELVEGSDEADA